MTRSAVLDALVEPAFLSVPDYHQTLGPEVADLATMAGFAPDPEQALALDAMFALDRHGKRVAFEVGVVCARQNLKTGLFKQAALGWLYLLEHRLVVWSAHEFGTAQEAFRDMCQLIESCPDLDREVQQIHRGNGDEAIELTGDRRLKFKARTKGGGRGLSGDDVVLDEGFALRPMHMGALLPTLSAHPDPQIVVGSSAGLAESDVLRAMRDRGRPGGDPRLAYLEWGDPRAHEGCAAEDCDHALNRPGCALDDVERWRLANPALGRRITVDYVAAERRALPPEEFARERLGWWDEPSQVIEGLTVEAWSDLAEPDAAPSGSLVLAADVAPGHASSAIVVVGGGVLELIERAPGSAWLVARLAELVERHGGSVAYDPAGPIGSLVPALTAAGVPLEPVEGKDSVRACGAIVQAVAERSFRHRGEPEFVAAVAGARRRAVGDGHKWSRKDSTVDISPLVAATVGLWVAGLGEPDYDVMQSAW